MNYTLESPVEYLVTTEKPDGWNVVKMVSELRVTYDKEDVIIEWEDPNCTMIGDYQIKLALGNSISHDFAIRSIPTNCSKLNDETRNQVRISQGGVVVCRTGKNLSGTLKLTPCVNYSLSVTSSIEEETFPTVSFVSPFHAQGTP